MIPRHQLSVASPVSVLGLLHAVAAVVRSSSIARTTVTTALTDRYSARALALTDSGTSALVLALRIAVGAGGTVAFPAFVCVDLVAAARFANVNVRLYDVDPHTLSPDLDSVRRVLAEGVKAIVVVHLFGLPADVPGVRAIAAPHGVTIIEDAAQQAGATLHGRPAGSLGDIAVLSFGRGKGTTAGNGGALLALTEPWTDPVHTADPWGDTTRTSTRTSTRTLRRTPARGTRDVASAIASWILGRPSIYDIPSRIPSLHLGETVYHDAHEPASLSHAAAALLQHSVAAADTHAALRQRNATALDRARDTTAPFPHPCHIIDGGSAGYLRYPLVTGKNSHPSPMLGIVRSYPRPLSEQPELRPILQSTREPLTGAHELANRLMTLPTHHLLTKADLDTLCAWLRTNTTAA